MFNSSDLQLGTYKHYKKSLYVVFGLAQDTNNNKYVIYQTKEKPQELWIRPHNIFVENVSIDKTTTIPRFKKNQSRELSVKDSMTNLLTLLDDPASNHIFSYTETNDNFIVTNITYDDSSYSITVCSINELGSSYLTDFQLAHRMGYYLFLCNNIKHVREIYKFVPDEKTLKIINHSAPTNKETLLSLFSNPCSLDLHIDDKCYYKTRFKKIDLTSLNIVDSQASDFWKKIYFKKYGGAAGVKLRPHQSILTHTLEEIQIPSNCAGKMEIKSTYARLSLSVTNSDFCNPGWSGYYPLSIRNDGTNTVILHPKEKMLQIMLIPTNEPINMYNSNSTYMNDDGTPFKFWRSKTVSALKTEIGNDDILKFFDKKRMEYSGEMQERFEDTFIKFCDKKKHKHKFKNHEDKADVERIFKAYIRRERVFNILSKIFNKIVTGIFSAISIVVSILAWLLPNVDINVLSDYKWHSAVVSVIVVIAFIISLIANAKHYCTSKSN
jgi:deoxycytidine triphosphate deaminase